MPHGFDRDPHSQGGEACPKNKLGLTDYAQLIPIEKAFAFQRSVELTAKPVRGRFDAAHLRAIHHYLFQDIFPWAGEFRVVGISKAGGAPFAVPAFIEAALNDLFSKLKSESYLHSLAADAFAARAAFYIGEINAVHPFREGNGRTQREFIRHLALEAGHTISWAGFTQDEMISASIASHTRGENAPLAAILLRALQTPQTP